MNDEGGDNRTQVGVESTVNDEGGRTIEPRWG